MSARLTAWIVLVALLSGTLLPEPCAARCGLLARWRHRCCPPPPCRAPPAPAPDVYCPVYGPMGDVGGGYHLFYGMRCQGCTWMSGSQPLHLPYPGTQTGCCVYNSSGQLVPNPACQTVGIAPAPLTDEPLPSFAKGGHACDVGWCGDQAPNLAPHVPVFRVKYRPDEDTPYIYVAYYKIRVTATRVLRVGYQIPEELLSEEEKMKFTDGSWKNLSSPSGNCRSAKVENGPPYPVILYQGPCP